MILVSFAFEVLIVAIMPMRLPFLSWFLALLALSQNWKRGFALKQTFRLDRPGHPKLFVSSDHESYCC